MAGRAQLSMDARMVGPRPHGIARYVVCLARALKRVAPDFRPVLVVGQDTPAEVCDEFAHVRCPAPYLSAAEILAVPAVVAQLGVRLHHATSFAVSPLMGVPQVITLHDAIHLQRRADYGFKQALYYRTAVMGAALRSPAIITVSQDARAALAHHLGLPLARLHVVPNGVEPHFTPGPGKERHGPVLTVTGPKPHKNTQVLLHALRHAPALTLNVAGTAMDGLEELASGLGVANRVRFLGPMDDAALVDHLRTCAAFALPSTVEGFGLPALEAMACGAPTVLSDIPVFREVAADATRFVSPLDAPAWAGALQALAADPAECARLSTCGMERATQFTWDETAAQTAKVYQLALAAKAAA